MTSSIMAENQRIHPVHDAETSTERLQNPTAPLVPRGSSKSDSLEASRSPRPPRRRRSLVCRCLCWSLALILLLLVILGLIAGIIFLVFRPKLPKYSVEGIAITEFNLGQDASLSARFNVNVTARNPNKKIGIYYEGGSEISAWYSEARLCEGSLPKFYQGHRNTTMMDVALSGQTRNATDLLERLQQEQQRTGTIPLRLKGKVPVRIKLGKLKLPEFKCRVRCRLVVDSLATTTIGIKSSSCKFRFRL